MPVSYPSGTVQEHLACRRSAVAFDVSHLGTVRVVGPTPSRRCSPSSPTTWARSLRVGLSTPTSSTPTTARCSTTSSSGGSTRTASTSCPTPPTPPACWRRSAAPTSPTSGPSLAVQGPEARRSWAPSRPMRPRSGGSGSTTFDWRGVPCIGRPAPATRARTASRSPCRPTPPLRLWRGVWRLVSAPAGLGARDTLRLEAALPLHGHELGPGITPLQAGLGWVVAWSKPTFRGRHALAGRAGRRCRPPAARARRRAGGGRPARTATCDRRCGDRADHERELLARARARHRPGLPAPRGRAGCCRRRRHPRHHARGPGGPDAVRRQVGPHRRLRYPRRRAPEPPPTSADCRPMEHQAERLERLEPGQAIPYGGDRVARVTAELAGAFRRGDRLIVDHEGGDLLHIPASSRSCRRRGRTSRRAFHALATVSDEQITDFFDRFARRLDDEEAFAPIAAANAADVDTARANGRSTTRLQSSRRRCARTWCTACTRWRDAGRRPATPAGPDRTRRLDGRASSCPARRRRLRVRGTPERVRRRDGRAPHRQHRRVPHRPRRARHGAGDREHALVPSLAGRRAARPGRRSSLDAAAHAAGWALFADRAPGARGGPRLRAGRRPARLGRPAVRRRRQPPRHGRSLARGRRGRRGRPLRRRGPAFARPQGVQHAQRLLHREGSLRRAGTPLPRRAEGWGSGTALPSSSTWSPGASGQYRRRGSSGPWASPAPDGATSTSPGRRR